MGRMQEKSVIITGGASGIGLAATRLFIEEGARVLIVDRDEVRLRSIESEMATSHLTSFVADLKDSRQIAAYTNAALEQFGRVDAALLNAGVCGPNTPLEEYPEEVFDEVIAINLKAVWLGLKALIPPMKAQGGGSIVLTSSIQGLAAVPGTSAYTASKHAIVGLTRGAALELASYGIRVNAVHPGYTATPMMESIHRAAHPERPEAFQEAVELTIPLRRYGRPEEVARLMLFLASDESSYSTGGCFTVDGGILAALP